ncbi:hypothetical protein A9G42_04735 [Gilliamella sp. Nev6-6]|nr:hypothetical protein A9G42_04735 [Gilliamella apicola]
MEVHDFFRVITSFIYSCQWFVAVLVGIDIQAAVCLFDAYFAQAVLGVVVVVLDSTDGLFGLGSAVLVVAVAVFSEMQQLVTADDILIAGV